MQQQQQQQQINRMEIGFKVERCTVERVALMFSIFRFV
jgi:hypothetical protein